MDDTSTPIYIYIMLDSEYPSEKAAEIYQKYIDWEMELDEVKERIILNKIRSVDNLITIIYWSFI